MGRDEGKGKEGSMSFWSMRYKRSGHELYYSACIFFLFRYDSTQYENAGNGTILSYSLLDYAAMLPLWSC